MFSVKSAILRAFVTVRTDTASPGSVLSDTHTSQALRHTPHHYSNPNCGSHRIPSLERDRAKRTKPSLGLVGILKRLWPQLWTKNPENYHGTRMRLCRRAKGGCWLEKTGPVSGCRCPSTSDLRAPFKVAENQVGPRLASGTLDPQIVI